MPTQTTSLEERIADFLAQPRIAVAGISANRDLPGNLIYRKLKSTGHQVFALSPSSVTFDGDPCYPELAAIPGGVDGLVIATRPNYTLGLVEQAIAAGVPRIWMHGSLAKSATSVDPAAVALGEAHGISVIGGTCPMMFCTPVDFGHRCMAWIMRATGGMPS